jgi:membrane fusion protein, multidrug efflux system
MKKILALALIAIMAAACGKAEDKQKELEKLKAEYAELGKKIQEIEKGLKTKDTTLTLIPVKTKNLSAITFKRSVEIQGNLESDKNIIVGSEVAGRIVEILVKEGQKIAKGQTIVRVNGDITANTINEVENALKLAEITYKKQKNLYAQNVGTEMQLLQAENQRDALKKQLETLRTQYGRYNITAPEGGVVDDVMVNSGENIMPGMPIARVVNNNQLKVVAEVSEKYLPSVKYGDSIYIRFPGINQTIGAKVSAIGQVINPANRTFTLTAYITNANDYLKPNLLALVTIFDYVKNNALAVPSNIITIDGNGSNVYVAETKNNKVTAKKVAVKTGQISGSLTEISEGLKEGDAVITENIKSLIDGTEVTIVK